MEARSADRCTCCPTLPSGRRQRCRASAVVLGRYALKRKHGVSFGEAESIFTDEHALLLDDPEHSADEDRFVLLGLSAGLRVLVVVHAYRKHRGVIRIVSARKATRKERDIYNQRWSR